MSLEIPASNISRVLLADGEWYEVQKGTIRFDTFSFVDDDDSVVGVEDGDGEPAIGMSFQLTNHEFMACPVGSILAVRYTSHPDQATNRLSANTTENIASALMRPNDLLPE